YAPSADRPPVVLTEHRDLAGKNGLVGVHVEGGRPRLAALSHRPAARAVEPFVELPRLLASLAVHGRQLGQLVCRLLAATGLHEGGDVEPADERPGATVVIVVGLVEVADAVVRAPVGLPRTYRGIERP